KAKPRISTTKPVVADNVTVSVVSERQLESATSRDWITASWPKGALSMRTVASARVSLGRAISMTPALAPNVVKGCVGPSKSKRRRPIVPSVAGVAAVTTPSALVRKKRRPAAVAQDGSTRVRTNGGCSLVGCLGDCCRRSAARSAIASSETISLVRVCRRGSTTSTRAPTQKGCTKAMIHTGTARRRRGSAVRSRRYAGLAIDCARPLIESACTDALATPARAIEGLRSEFPLLQTEGCAHRFPNHLLIGIDGRRFVESPRSQILKKCYPRLDLQQLAGVWPSGHR